ncbi:MAG TPA: alpha/beta hydrolase [Polyangia bacterium]
MKLLRLIGLTLAVLWTTLAVTARRLFKGPRLAGWTMRFELAVAVTRTIVDDSVHWPPEVLRRRFVGVPMDHELRARITRASAQVGGRPAETFTPVGWTEAAPTILYFHGGGYVVGSPATHADLIARLALAAGARAVAVDYRKASEQAFPAAVDDGEAAYRDLLAAGARPAHLYLAGDSAGGGLALAVALRARDAALPLPAALLLLSPWTSLAGQGDSMLRNAPFDYLTARALRRAANDYARGADARHVHASVIHADFHGLPPLFIQSGGAEVLLSDNEALAARARSAGVRVVHDVEENMVHVFPAFYRVLPRQSEAALARLGQVVRGHGAAADRAPDVSSLPTAR